MTSPCHDSVIDIYTLFGKNFAHTMPDIEIQNNKYTLKKKKIFIHD